MCGIAGFIDSSRTGDDAWLRQTALAMADSLAHRGPDDRDSWSDAGAGMGMGFRRLAVIDLSSTGRQPMVSHCQRFVISYNGEIYNAPELRARLPDVHFRGHSDTEVLLEACAAWGVEETVRQLNGMFAFALWDRTERCLSLARDRLGIKPLYWGAFKDLFLFASELKAIRRYPGWSQEIDRDALATFMQYRYIPAPRSIYRGINKLEPGRLLTLQAGQEPSNTAYWNISGVISRAREKPFEGSDEDAVSQLDGLLTDAIERRMVADVPLGAFLSGGIDSTTVVALMQQQGTHKAQTFSIGFEDANYDEAGYARQIAEHLGSSHTELYVGAKQAMDVIPLLPAIYDEPFADSSQIPTFLVSKMTREHVTVALSGDGGDELFAGYNRYQTAVKLGRLMTKIRPPLRSSVIRLLRSLGPAKWDSLLRFLGRGDGSSYPGHKLHHLATILSAGQENIYRELVSEWNEPQLLVTGTGAGSAGLWSTARAELLDNPVEKLQYLDTLNYLPDDILTKVDRASMAVSLEARTPLLDHRVVEFVWRLPFHYKIRNKQRKWLLRQVLNRYVPAALMDRPKTGFKIPVGEWLKGPLRDWAESLLDEQRLRDAGYLNPLPVREKWQEHLDGHRNWKGPLWNVLMFEAWLDTQ